MREILAHTITAIATGFLALTALILGHKAWRQLADGSRLGRRTKLEPAVDSWLRGRAPSLAESHGAPFARSDRGVLTEILLERAAHVHGSSRGRISAELERLGAVDRLLRRLDSRRAWRRAEAAGKLGRCGAPRAVRALARTMRDPSAEVRLRAARSLGRLGGEEAARAVVGALRDPERWSPVRIADILTSMGRRVVEELISAFPELPVPGKLAVLDVLGRIHSLRAAGWLAGLLSDPEPDVRARACHALGCIGDPRSAEPLRAALEDPEWPVRAMAAKGLGRIRHIEAIPALSGSLRDGEWWVRANAARALHEMGCPGIRELEQALESPDRYARDQAVRTLQETGVFDERVTQLGASDQATRARADEFVRRLVQGGQLERLRELAESLPDDRTRGILVELLPQEAEPVEAVR